MKLSKYPEIYIECPECGHDRGIVTMRYVRCKKCGNRVYF